MAIVSTLWSLALLGAIALSLSFTGNMSYRLAENSFRIAHDKTLAEAAISRVVLGLLDPRPEKRWRLGTEHIFAFSGEAIRIHITDELGKVDLNQTDGAILAQLFTAAGLDQTAAGALVDKVLDWRDGNPLKRLNGAKAADYRAAGYRYGPRNGPFQSVDELTLVMGVTHDVYQRIAPALTVYSGRQFVDPQFVAPAVLAALPSLANGAQISNTGPSGVDVLGFGGMGSPITALTGRAFTIDIEITRSSDPIRNRTVVRITGNSRLPYWILNWQRT